MRSSASISYGHVVWLICLIHNTSTNMRTVLLFFLVFWYQVILSISFRISHLSIGALLWVLPRRWYSYQKHTHTHTYSDHSHVSQVLCSMLYFGEPDTVHWHFYQVSYVMTLFLMCGLPQGWPFMLYWFRTAVGMGLWGVTELRPDHLQAGAFIYRAFMYTLYKIIQMQWCSGIICTIHNCNGIKCEGVLEVIHANNHFAYENIVTVGLITLTFQR